MRDVPNTSNVPVMTKTQYPTPQGVSRTLKAAGHKRSESNTTRVRGYRKISEGFTVSGSVSGKVIVEYMLGDRPGERTTMHIRAAEKLRDLASTLEDEGYNIESVDAYRILIGYGQ